MKEDAKHEFSPKGMSGLENRTRTKPGSQVWGNGAWITSSACVACFEEYTAGFTDAFILL
jgi:hypothetical protein